jgi:predicted TIM-barrel fold metal-dependent hydrolase
VTVLEALAPAIQYQPAWQEDRMLDYKLFSGDSHVSEPPDLWTKRIDGQFLFRAPYVETRERDGKRQDYMIYEGFPPHPVSIGLAAAAADKDGDKSRFHVRASRYADALPGGWDPAARLKDQDLDGVDGEVLHPTLGFRLFWLKDGNLQRAVFRSYNDWLGEYISHDRRRLVGLALISIHDIGAAIGEIERAAKLGHKGIMIALSPPARRPYSLPEYDPVWATAQGLGLPIVLHAITGAEESRLGLAYWNPEMVLYPILRHHEMNRTLAHLILSGVLERFPRLVFVSAENEIGWIPQALARMDHAMSFATRALEINVWPTRLSMKPSEYFRRQVCVGFIDEPEAIPMRHEIGVDNLMWASDYPHFASTWPKSREFVARTTAGVDSAERRKLVRDNALRTFNLA